jgi:hypothetical protein
MKNSVVFPSDTLTLRCVAGEGSTPTPTHTGREPFPARLVDDPTQPVARGRISRYPARLQQEFIRTAGGVSMDSVEACARLSRTSFESRPRRQAESLDSCQSIPPDPIVISDQRPAPDYGRPRSPTRPTANRRRSWRESSRRPLGTAGRLTRLVAARTGPERSTRRQGTGLVVVRDRIRSEVQNRGISRHGALVRRQGVVGYDVARAQRIQENRIRICRYPHNVL